MNLKPTTNLGRQRSSACSLLPVLNIRPTPISDQHIPRCTAQHHEVADNLHANRLRVALLCSFFVLVEIVACSSALRSREQHPWLLATISALFFPYLSSSPSSSFE